MEELLVPPDSFENHGAEEEGEILAGGAGGEGGAAVEGGGEEERAKTLEDPAEIFSRFIVSV